MLSNATYHIYSECTLLLINHFFFSLKLHTYTTVVLKINSIVKLCHIYSYLKFGIYTGEMATKQIITAALGSDVYLECPNHNSTISWAINLFYHINFTTALSYSQNMSGMVIYNITSKEKGDYTCYSEEDAIGYAMIKVITESMIIIIIICTTVSRYAVI